MANMVRFDPFSAVTPIERTFNDLFNSLLRPLQALTPVDQELRSFKMDVHETDKKYVVHADLPGVQKEDIHVSIEGNQVTINAEAKELPWQTGSAGQENGPPPQADLAKNLRRERHIGRLYRSFTLPVDIDDSNARAKYDNGVLTLTLPKKQQLGKQLAIEQMSRVSCDHNRAVIWSSVKRRQATGQNREKRVLLLRSPGAYWLHG